MAAGTELSCKDHVSWLFSSGPHVFAEPELLETLPSPGMSFDLEPGFVQHGLWDDWDYRLKIRVTRVGDVVEDRPVER